MKFSKATFLLLLLSGSTFAGINGLTIHSRANCVNNESITWDLTENWQLATISTHYKDGIIQHSVPTGWQNTWRSAAVHWGEGTGGWYVEGQHYIIMSGVQKNLGTTRSENCSGYDGWWDKSK